MIVSVAKANQAADILGVELETLNPDVLRSAWRNISKRLHPDVAKESYDQQKWAQADWAHAVLKHWLDKSRPASSSTELLAKGDCRACSGSGRIAVGKPRGFGGKPTTLQCVMCAGSGMVTEGQRGYFGRSE